MPGRLAGKVAFVTGAARGQGRSHAITLAQEGADIIAIDIAKQIDSVPFPMGTAADLAETVKEVEALGRRIVAAQADVRNHAELKQALDDGVSELGRLDIVVASAAITGFAGVTEITEQAWHDVLDTNLTGVWHTVRTAVPHLQAGGNGGSIILIGSAATKGTANVAHYVAAKMGVVGLMRVMALELASDMIRVNLIHPGNVRTPMLQNDATYRLFRPDLENPGPDDITEALMGLNALPVPMLEPHDISNAVAFLAADDSRYITGVTLPVDIGMMLK